MIGTVGVFNKYSLVDHTHRTEIRFILLLYLFCKIYLFTHRRGVAPYAANHTLERSFQRSRRQALTCYNTVDYGGLSV